MPDPLREAVERLAPFLEQTLLLAADADAERQTARLERLRKLFDSRLRHLDTLSRPPLVVVIGGTNVGKSTIANLLLGRPLGLPCPTAVGTKAVGLAVPTADAAAFRDAAFLPWFDKRAWTAPEPLNEPFDGDRPRLFLQAVDGGPRVALADTPDIDATLERNHRTTEDVFLLADAVVYVTTPTKYADEACVEYLARAARYGKAVWVVFNRGERDSAGLRDLVDNLLPAEGLPRDTPVLAVPFRPGIETADGPWRGELAAVLPDLAARGPAIVHRAAVGTAAGLAAEYGGLLDHLAGEAAAVEAWLHRARQAAAREGERYAHRMPPLPRDVLDDAVLTVLKELRVPVVDWVYEKLGAILAPVRRAARQAVAAVQ
ncbi:MAG: 50S ribosome-binding GTPase, partial [Armatimonadetes bacterium]|nr:50S ribosome-binding GTPase [Armatimonadota bacterium]